MQQRAEGVGGAAHGYTKAKDKEKIQNRLRRIEGQVRGVQRMVDEEAYCVDVLTQISSIVSALEKAGAILLKDHGALCPRVHREGRGRRREDRGTDRRRRAVFEGLEREDDR